MHMPPPKRNTKTRLKRAGFINFTSERHAIERINRHSDRIDNNWMPPDPTAKYRAALASQFGAVTKKKKTYAEQRDEYDLALRQARRQSAVYDTGQRMYGIFGIR